MNGCSFTTRLVFGFPSLCRIKVCSREGYVIDLRLMPLNVLLKILLAFDFFDLKFCHISGSTDDAFPLRRLRILTSFAALGLTISQ